MARGRRIPLRRGCHTITSDYLGGGVPMALRLRRLARATGLRPYNSPAITLCARPNFRIIYTQLRALDEAPDGDMDGGMGRKQ